MNTELYFNIETCSGVSGIEGVSDSYIQTVSYEQLMNLTVEIDLDFTRHGYTLLVVTKVANREVDEIINWLKVRCLELKNRKERKRQ